MYAAVGKINVHSSGESFMYTTVGKYGETSIYTAVGKFNVHTTGGNMGKV